jgi:hypothetical protein
MMNMGPMPLPLPPNPIPNIDDLLRNMNMKKPKKHGKKHGKKKDKERASTLKKVQTLTYEQTLCCPAFVKGFVIGRKKWGRVHRCLCRRELY